MTVPLDLIGHKYGRLTVEEFAGNFNGRRSWHCLCECGNKTVALGDNLRGGNTTSCGCRRIENIFAVGYRHGRSKTSIHNIWSNMLRRCSNFREPRYKDYGGRGIKVCARWHVFENFLADMGERPSKGHSLDRKDVNGDYEPSNVRWATRSEQARNTRNSKIIETPNGPMQIDDAADFYKVPRNRLRARVYNGLPKDVWFAPNLRDWRNQYKLS